MGSVPQKLISRVGAMCLVAILPVCAAASGAPGATESGRTKADPWQSALLARQVFEAEAPGTHTRIDYARVMDGFRAIYHANPGDPHAAKSVEQVAELLAEEGRELGDRKSLRDAAGQYEFLATAYPGGSLAPVALGQALDLLNPDAANDAAEASKVKSELLSDYPRSSAARALRTELAENPSRATRPQRSSSPQVPEPPRLERVADTPPPLADTNRQPEKQMAQVTGIRHWSTSTYTRVAIDLGDEVQYQAARVENPDRIFFDLHHARLASELVGKSFDVPGDGLLTRIRAAQFSNDVTRVVLDVHNVGEYSAFLLPNPYRLIIDIHGKPPASVAEQAGAESAPVIASRKPHTQTEATLAARTDDPPASTENASAVDPPAVDPVAVDPPSGPVEVSSLPPMPVTDGSDSFGLPAKKGRAESGRARTAGSTSSKDVAAVARPRVVISSRSTRSKPVPNTVTSNADDSRAELADVSEQPGMVEATRHPTSQPIVARSRGEGDFGSGSYRSPRHAAHVAGTPAEVAPPTADGETSLMRALGLKIGRIVIDAGHGGHDSGTLGVGGIEEKDVVLDVALRLGKLLHDRLGAEIVYTRADDTFVPLETRTAIANKAQADLFISVHANSSSDPDARGVEVYYLNFTSDPDAMRVAARENAVSTESVHELSDLVKKIALKDKIDESRELAADVDAGLYAGLEKGNPGLKNRGVKKAPFVVLIGANMPSILAEISFVTNPDSAAELQRPAYRERVAESLYNGVARYAEGINGAKAPPPRIERAAR